MNVMRILIAGLAGGVVMWLVSFVLHGLVLGNTYLKYPVFSQEASNPIHFLILEVLIAIPAAIIFMKTRPSWRPGVAGGLVFGFWLGAFGFFAQFFNPLVIEGFPYYLGWCWGGVNLIVSLFLGLVLGGLIKAPSAAL